MKENCNSVIEKEFPITFINNITRKETHSKKPIYELHRWWARRPGSVFRAIILGSLLKDGNGNKIESLFYQNLNLNDKIILDPMCGGGTTLVEGVRLGCKVIGIDLNPVAWFVTKKELDTVDIKKLKEYFKIIEKRIASKIKKYYTTQCSNCGGNADIIYTFWVKKITCSNCKRKIPLFTTFKLAELKDGTSWMFCPHCKSIFYNRKDEEVCKICGRTLMMQPSKPTHYKCYNCGNEESIKERIKNTPEMEMFAIEFYCPVCKIRAYKTVEEKDIRLFEEAKKEFIKMKDNLPFPKQKIPIGKEVKRLFKYNYQYFYQFFNERQLLCLSLLLKEILEIDDENIKEFFLLAFSDCLDNNNMFARYNQKARKIEPMFAHHAYYPKNMPAENNVWGTKYGRGSFIKCFNKMLKAKKFCEKPYELFVRRNKSQKIYIQNNRVIGKLVDTFRELKQNKGNTILKCQSAEDLSFIPDKTIDAVITDPPYYDNIMYSELSDFYYVWLRIGLMNKYPWFRPEYTPKKEEAVVNTVAYKNGAFYMEKIKNIFRECYRVLKDEGILAFTFHHKKEDAWIAILQATLDAGFKIMNIYPIYSEMSTSFHILRKNSQLYDAVIVCRKKPPEYVTMEWNRLIDKTLPTLEDTLKNHLSKQSYLEKENLLMIAFSSFLRLYSAHYPRVYKEGKRVDVKEFLASTIPIIEEYIKGVLDKIGKIENKQKQSLIGEFINSKNRKNGGNRHV